MFKIIAQLKKISFGKKHPLLVEITTCIKELDISEHFATFFLEELTLPTENWALLIKQKM